MVNSKDAVIRLNVCSAARYSAARTIRVARIVQQQKNRSDELSRYDTSKTTAGHYVLLYQDPYWCLLLLYEEYQTADESYAVAKH